MRHNLCLKSKLVVLIIIELELSNMNRPSSMKSAPLRGRSKNSWEEMGDVERQTQKTEKQVGITSYLYYTLAAVTDPEAS